MTRWGKLHKQPVGVYLIPGGSLSVISAPRTSLLFSLSHLISILVFFFGPINKRMCQLETNHLLQSACCRSPQIKVGPIQGALW